MNIKVDQKCRDGSVEMAETAVAAVREAPRASTGQVAPDNSTLPGKCTLLWTLDPETAARHSFPRSGFCRIVPRSCHTEQPQGTFKMLELSRNLIGTKVITF